MLKERILSLDVSTKTGYALIISEKENFTLEAYGKLQKTSEPEGSYPETYVIWSSNICNELVSLIYKFEPDVLVIEETTSGSKSAYSQKILEYIHYNLAKFIIDNKIKSVYMLTEQWRRETGCLMSKEESKRNKEVKKYKEKNSTNIAYDINGKRIGKITRKHINVRRANEIFGNFLKEPLKRKDEDMADALLLGISYHMKRNKFT